MKELTKPIGILDKNGYERINRVYYFGGYSPCITGRDCRDPIKILVGNNGTNKYRKENR